MIQSIIFKSALILTTFISFFLCSISIIIYSNIFSSIFWELDSNGEDGLSLPRFWFFWKFQQKNLIVLKWESFNYFFLSKNNSACTTWKASIQLVKTIFIWKLDAYQYNSITLSSHTGSKWKQSFYENNCFSNKCENFAWILRNLYFVRIF